MYTALWLRYDIGEQYQDYFQESLAIMLLSYYPHTLELTNGIPLTGFSSPSNVPEIPLEKKDEVEL